MLSLFIVAMLMRPMELPSPFPVAWEFDGVYWRLRDGCTVTGNPNHIQSLRIQCAEELWPE